MSEQAVELTPGELRAAQAATRGEPTDAGDFAQLLGAGRLAAERLLQPGLHTPALELAVLLCLVSRLRGADAARDEGCEAIRVHRRLQREGVMTPGRDLTMDEMRAAEALLRGQDADIGAASDLLGCSTAAARRLLLTAGDSRALDGMLIAMLLVRLHGRRAGLEELRDALLTIIERETAALRRAGAH